VRLFLHQHGQAARLTQVVRAAGIGFQLARLWRFDTYAKARAFEHKLKRAGHAPRYCPICQHKPLNPEALLYYGHWPFTLHDRHRAWKPRADAGYLSLLTFVCTGLWLSGSSPKEVSLLGWKEKKYQTCWQCSLTVSEKPVAFSLVSK
jgi:hypothetical protein